MAYVSSVQGKTWWCWILSDADRQQKIQTTVGTIVVFLFVCFEGGERYFVSVVSVFFFFFLSFHSFLHLPLKEVEVHGPWALQEDFFNV